MRDENLCVICGRAAALINEFCFIDRPDLPISFCQPHRKMGQRKYQSQGGQE